MKTTLTIILTILFLTFSTAFAQKTGYCKTFPISPVGLGEPNELTLFTVPLDTHFVLERIYISGRSGYWSLSANSNFSIQGLLYLYTSHQATFEVYEFPNGSAVFNAENDIVLSYIPSNVYELFLTIIGHFEDITPVKSSADVNGDGKIDMLDFAILSKQWLNGT